MLCLYCVVFVCRNFHRFISSFFIFLANKCFGLSSAGRLSQSMNNIEQVLKETMVLVCDQHHFGHLVVFSWWLNSSRFSWWMQSYNYWWCRDHIMLIFVLLCCYREIHRFISSCFIFQQMDVLASIPRAHHRFKNHSRTGSDS